MRVIKMCPECINGGFREVLEISLAFDLSIFLL